MSHWRRDAPILQRLLDDYALVSGLQLNMDKCVWVDLADGDPQVAQNRVQQASSYFGAMKFATSAKYLGYYLGPGRGELSWQKPLQKFAERAKFWGQSGGGLHVAAMAYSVYVLPVLTFVAQLEDPPEDWDKLEKAGFGKLVPCPGNSGLPRLAPHLAELGMPKSFARLRQVALAAKLRIASREALAVGGLRVLERSRLLRRLEQGTEYVVRAARWKPWFDKSFLHVIAAAVGELRGKGITPFRLEICLAGPGPRPWTRAQARRAHKGLQRAAVQELISQQPGGTEYMQILRRAADRWRIPLLPGRRVDRWLGTLAWLRRQVPPRVVAGMLRTLTNS
jgi:hypothetical protein